MGGGAGSSPLMEHRGNIAAGFQTFYHFQVDVCLQKIPGSSRPGQSVGVSPGFIKGPCDGISIRDDDGGRRAELPAYLICDTRRRDFSPPSLFLSYAGNWYPRR